MGKSDEDYGDPERRQGINADLRARLIEIARKVSEHPELTEDDMNQLYELIRDYDLRGSGSTSFDMLQIVREMHAKGLSPALLALLDNVMGFG